MASSKSRIPLPRPKGAGKSGKMRVATAVKGPIVFGVVLPIGSEDLQERLDRFVWWLNKRAKLDLELREAESYESLAGDVKKGRVDVAWLPPVVHVRLASEVSTLGTILRGGRVTYEAALAVRKDSKIKTVLATKGTRAGWVDPWSAAGYVLPRVSLALLGADLQGFFASETFYGSHQATVKALLEGDCDVIGTYARADGKGKVTGGAWSDVTSGAGAGVEVRVLETFGAIPPDVIATRAGLVEPQRDAIRGAFQAASETEEGRRLLRAAFGGDTFVEDMQKSYDSLARALDVYDKMATSRGPLR